VRKVRNTYLAKGGEGSSIVFGALLCEKMPSTRGRKAGREGGSLEASRQQKRPGKWKYRELTGKGKITVGNAVTKRGKSHLREKKDERRTERFLDSEKTVNCNRWCLPLPGHSSKGVNWGRGKVQSYYISQKGDSPVNSSQVRRSSRKRGSKKKTNQQVVNS